MATEKDLIEFNTTQSTAAMNNVKVSIIIPVYNVEEYLAEALESVINQTLKDIEIICVDDCSTDNSLTMLKNYASRDSRIVLLEQKENKGQGTARNRALDIAKGEVIMFLDPDDWYTLDSCEKVYSQITKNKNDFVYMNYCFCSETGNGRIYKSGEYHLNGFLEKANCPDIKLWELKNNFWHNVNTVCRAYKKDFLEKYHIRYDEKVRLCEDVPFFAKCIVNAKSVSIIWDELYTIRDRAGSTSKTAGIYEGAIVTRKEAYELFKSSEHSQDLLIPCLCYMLTILSHFNRLTKINKKITKEFYNKIREFFVFLNENEDMKAIKEHSPHYNTYRKIIKNPYFVYKIKQFFKNIISAEVIEERGTLRYVISVLGATLKIKIRPKYKKLNEYRTAIKKRIYNKIKNNQPINVIFISSEMSKWGYSSLFNKFKKSKYFNPKVIVFPLRRVHGKSDNTQPDLRTQYNFYKDQGFDVEYAYNLEKHFYRSIKRYCPDMIFYQQPWGLPNKYLATSTSEYALPFYVSYSFDVTESKAHYTDNFHKFMYTYFVDTKLNLETYAKYDKAARSNCIVTGYPKLDEYLDSKPLDYKKYWKQPEKYKIIYAPHFSFEKNGIHLATFEENGKLILELAQSHPETTWVFKPHPKFEFSLLKNNIMTEEEIKEYYKNWEQTGNIVVGGNYIDLFKTSDLMITDCGSFLGEYLPSGKPLIQLVNPKAIFSELGKKVKSEYYHSHNNEELKKMFEEIVVKRNDYKKEARAKLSDEIFDFSKPASDKIYNYIENLVLNTGIEKCKK